MEKEALNVVDLKILKLLDEAPSMTITKLAYALRTSVATAEYKIQRLISLGAIDKFCTVINIFNAGYRLFRVSFLLKSTDFSSRKEIEQHLVNHDNTMWVAHVGGDWDLLVDFFALNPSELEQILNAFLEKFGGKIFGFEVMEILKFYETNYKDINDKKTRIYPILPDGKKNLTKKDILVLDAVKSNCRKSKLSISHECGIAYNTVSQILKKMESSGIIVGKRLLLNPSVRNKQMYKVFISLVDPRAGNIDQVLSFCSANKYVYDVVNMLGEFQIDFEVAVDNFSELQDIILFLRERFGFIKEIKYVPVFSNLKLDHFPQSKQLLSGSKNKN